MRKLKAAKLTHYIHLFKSRMLVLVIMSICLFSKSGYSQPPVSFSAGMGFSNMYDTRVLNFKVTKNIESRWSFIAAGNGEKNRWLIGPEFTYHLNANSVDTAGATWTWYGWELSLTARHLAYANSSRFAIYPIIGLNLTHRYNRYVEGGNFAEVPENYRGFAYGGVLGAGAHFKISRYFQPFVEFNFVVGRDAPHRMGIAGILVDIGKPSNKKNLSY